MFSVSSGLVSAVSGVAELARRGTRFSVRLQGRLGMTSTGSILSRSRHVGRVCRCYVRRVVEGRTGRFCASFPLRSVGSALVKSFVQVRSFEEGSGFKSFYLSLCRRVRYVAGGLYRGGSLSSVARGV